jgi:TonB-linked SusC/RagA family outer membrane protein
MKQVGTVTNSDEREFIRVSSGLKITDRFRIFKFLSLTFVLLVFSFGISAQSINVTGKVIDEATGEAIAGASIVVENSNVATLSDAEGKYSINVKNPDDVLICSFVGYISQKVKVSGQNRIDFSLKQEVKSLDEVVVVGYGTVTRQNLTTSVAKVKTDDVPKAAINSVNQMLFGRAAGLKTTQESAEPGGRIDLSIRGRGNPLVVIDGVAYPSDELNPSSGVVTLNNVNRGGITNINPEDIESIEILKDASASIYGIGAANGVVLITTKKGKAGNINVTYDGSRSQVENMPYIEPLNPKDYMTLYNEFNKEYYWASKNMQPFGTLEPRVPKTIFLYSDSAIANPPKATDWLGMVLREGSVDNHNLNVSGGNERISFYVSGNYYNQIGTIENSDLRRYLGKIDLSIKLASFVKLNAAMNASRANYSNGMSGYQLAGSGSQGYGALQAAIAYPTLLPVKDADGNYSKFQLIGNPVSLLSIKDNTQQSTLFINTSLDFEIIPKMLFAKILYGNNYETASRDFFVPSTVFYQQLYQARGAIDNSQRENQTFSSTVSFMKNFSNTLQFDIMAGYEQNTTNYLSNGLSASGMLDALENYNMGAASNRDLLSSSKRVDKKRSYFSRANFNFLDRYLLSLTYRYDGLDKFFPDKKYASFPSASLGWKISKESFMQSASFIDLLKIRASIGVTGDASNVINAAYGIFSADTRDQVYFDNGATVYTPYYLTSIDLPDLEWQKSVNTNVGLDFGFFRNRISGSFELFKDKITNLLNSKTTSQLSMLTTIYANGGQQIRQGWELALKTVNIASQKFQWEMVVNLSHYLYRWEKRYSNMGLQSYVGEKDPVNAIYVFPTKGIIQIGDSIPASQYTIGNGKAAKPGCPLFVDRNGDDTINNADVVMYNTDPDLIIGFGNTFRYRNFDLNIFFYSQLGAKDFNNTYAWASAKNFGSGNINGTTAAIKDAWRINNPSGTLPGASYDEESMGMTASSDVFVQSKDFLRCRNITLGYTFKPGTRKYFSNIRIYADVQNPFIITNYKIIDPEIQYVSVKGGSAPYPMARTYSLGITLNF